MKKYFILFLSLVCILNFSFGQITQNPQNGEIGVKADGGWKALKLGDQLPPSFKRNIPPNTPCGTTLENGFKVGTIGKIGPKMPTQQKVILKDGQKPVTIDYVPQKKDKGIGDPQPISNYKSISPQQRLDRNQQQNPGITQDRNGKFYSHDGREVEFVVADHEPGICGTPQPRFVDETGRTGCGTVVPCDDPANRDANIPLPGDPIKWIELRWTVVRSTAGGAGSNIDQTRVDDLMLEMNADYLPYRIQFCSNPVTFVTDDTYFALNAGTEDGGLKAAYNQTPGSVCNIYVVNTITNPAAGGYAYFPYGPPGGLNPGGGIVLARGNCFVGTHTLAHEMGHTMGLYHTFNGVSERGSCSSCYERTRNANGSAVVTGVPTPPGGPYPDQGDLEGDYCSDTHPHPQNSNQCPGPAGATGGCDGFARVPGNFPVDNHMSYSFCTSTFSPQQGGRMHCMIDTYLSPWVANGGGICAGMPPVADFVGNPTSGYAPHAVTFTDLSQPAAVITSWTWEFDLAATATVSCPGCVGPTVSFVGQVPPVVTYSAPGTYDVRLTVTGNGGDVETKLGYIVVNPFPSGGASCDTLDNWNTPPNTGAFVWTWGPNDYVTGMPNSFFDIVYYERFFTAGPNYVIGEIEVWAGETQDLGPDNLDFQISIYPDDPLAPGFPDLTSPLGGSSVYGADTIFAPIGFYNTINFTFCDPIQLGANTNFYVAFEVINGDFSPIPQPTDDRVVLMATNMPFGQAAGLNGEWSLFPIGPGTFTRYFQDVGLNVDLGLIPTLGEIAPFPWLGNIFGFQVCDTTLIVYTDTVYCSTPVLWEFDFSDGVYITDTLYAPIDTFGVLYFDQGPVNLTIRTTNECGRVDSTLWIINYPLDTTPEVNFSRAPVGNVCTCPANVTFTATPAGLASYDWDFGDGTTTTTAGNVAVHCYTTPGTYYVSLDGNSAFPCSDNETKLDYVIVTDCAIAAPDAGFEIFPDQGCIPWPAAFADTSKAVPDPATSWYWDFGDGNFSILQNPVHNYLIAGTYQVMLVAYNAGGSDTAYFTVTALPLPCVLPVATQLAGAPVNDNVVLTWETVQDIPGTNFEVERSYDGNTYEKIGRVKYAERVAVNLYDFVDYGPTKGLPILYRLKVISPDGDFDYTNVIEVSLDNSDEPWLSVYPNPIRQYNVLNIDTRLDKDAQVMVQMYDLVGRIVLTQTRTFNAGFGRMEIQTGRLSKGTYLIKVIANDRAELRRVVVD